MPTAEQVVQTVHEQARVAEHKPGRPGWRVLALIALAGSALVLQACGEEEQNRPLMPDKGTYQGPVDQKLDQEQIDALRQRAGEQRI